MDGHCILICSCWGFSVFIFLLADNICDIPNLEAVGGFFPGPNQSCSLFAEIIWINSQEYQISLIVQKCWYLVTTGVPPTANNQTTDSDISDFVWNIQRFAETYSNWWRLMKWSVLSSVAIFQRIISGSDNDMSLSALGKGYSALMAGWALGSAWRVSGEWR